MRKLILSLVIVTSLFMMSFTSINKTEEKKVVEDDGRRCVNVGLQWVTDAVDAGIGDGNLNGNDHDEYMTIYHFYYRECMLGNL